MIEIRTKTGETSDPPECNCACQGGVDNFNTFLRGVYGGGCACTCIDFTVYNWAWGAQV